MSKSEKKVRWVALESNPNAFNEYMESLGISGAECAELYGFDDDMLEFIPKPHIALIFCFPDFYKAIELMKPIYSEHIGKEIPSKIFFMKQKISNACGTFSLFHAIANNLDKVEIGDGPFAQWLKEAKGLKMEERSDCLAKNVALTGIHKMCAELGETEHSDNVDHHFISYMNIDGNLYEFDSAQEFPRLIGPTSQESLLSDAGKVCKELMKKLGNISCSAIALVMK